MIKRVVIAALMVFGTNALGHNSDPCANALASASVTDRLNAYGFELADYSAQVGVLSFGVPEFRPAAVGLLSPLIKKLQKQLRQLRSTSDKTTQSQNLEIFEQSLAEARGEITARIAAGLDLYLQNKPDEALEYAELFAKEILRRQKPIDRGVQHPDRPMKRETLYFDGLEFGNWPNY